MALFTDIKLKDLKIYNDDFNKYITTLNKLDLCKKNTIFEKKHILGKGSFGAVYKTCIYENRKCKQVIAVKRIKSSKVDDYNREVNNLVKAVGGKGLTQIIANWNCKVDRNNYYYIVMTYMPGTKMGVTPRTRDWKTIIKNIFKAIEELDKRKINHGDLHEDNILIDQNDYVYIIDFGWYDTVFEKHKNLLTFISMAVYQSSVPKEWANYFVQFIRFKKYPNKSLTKNDIRELSWDSLREDLNIREPERLLRFFSNEKIDCHAINNNFKTKLVINWTENDRNTAISLINHIKPYKIISYLGSLTNIVLKRKIDKLCSTN
jgi:serine/threonine protein kinase